MGPHDVSEKALRGLCQDKINYPMSLQTLPLLQCYCYIRTEIEILSSHSEAERNRVRHIENIFPEQTVQLQLLLHGHSADCNTALSQIKSLKIVKKVGDTAGSWFKDPSEGSSKVCC